MAFLRPCIVTARLLIGYQLDVQSLSRTQSRK
jgi:hypothetical protein